MTEPVGDDGLTDKEREEYAERWRTGVGSPFIKKLDFSEFHPLDHSVWECRGYPGGRRVHLRYRWDFQWRDELHAKFLCPLGRHRRVEWFGRGESGFCCGACSKDME
jgi:hypothetical protein